MGDASKVRLRVFMICPRPLNMTSFPGQVTCVSDDGRAMAKARQRRKPAAASSTKPTTSTKASAPARRGRPKKA